MEKGWVYKLDLSVTGNIGEAEFLGKKVIIAFEYIEKEEHDNREAFLTEEN